MSLDQDTPTKCLINRNMKNKFMLLALEEAELAYKIDEVPVGAVIVLDGEVIASGHNTRERNQDVFSHAELNAIKKAQEKLGSWRLENCELYVTLEPCPMCAGAIIQSRIKKVFIGASDPKGGAAGSVTNLFSHPWNHQVEIEFGIIEERSSLLLKDFFKKLRK